MTHFSVTADNTVLQIGKEFGACFCNVLLHFLTDKLQIVRMYEPLHILLSCHLVSTFLLGGSAMENVERIIKGVRLRHGIKFPVHDMRKIRCLRQLALTGS